MIETRSFTHINRQFTVKATPENEGWKARVFEGDDCISHTYMVSYETLTDMQFHEISFEEVIEILTNTAENDIKQSNLPK